MAKEYKILAQAAPTVTTEQLLYAVPAGKQAVVSFLNVVNRDAATPVKVSVAALTTDVATGDQHYVVKDQLVAPGKTERLCAGICGSAGTLIRVTAAPATASFSLFGVEG